MAVEVTLQSLLDGYRIALEKQLRDNLAEVIQSARMYGLTAEINTHSDEYSHAESKAMADALLDYFRKDNKLDLLLRY